MSGTLSFNPITQTPTPVSHAPRPLQDWCRYSVVTMIGLANMDRIQSLPIPRRMKDMLGGLTLADFFIDAEKLPPESHTSRVYPATCLLTNTQVNVQVLTSANEINKDDPSYLCNFEEDGHWIVVSERTSTMSALIHQAKTEGKMFDESVLWQVLEALIEHITRYNISPTAHLSSECIKFCGNKVIVTVEESQSMDPGQPINAVYEAPEVLSNNNPDSRALVWSIGCIIYEALALEPAFYDPTGTNPFSVYMNITNAVIPPVPTNGSEEVRDLMAKCLVHNRDNRITFDDLRQLIENHSFN